MSTAIKNIIIVVVVVGVLLAGYIFIFQPGSSDNQEGTLQSSSGENPVAEQTSSNNEASQEQTNADIISILNSLRSLNLDDSVLYNPAFNKLQDISMPLVETGDTGRRNPFAPIGSDPRYSPVTSNSLGSGQRPGDATSSCSSRSCFENKFTSCTPTSFTVSEQSRTRSSAFGQTQKNDLPLAQYQIVGEGDSGCGVEINAEVNTDQGTQIASMTCPFSTDASFFGQLQDTSEETLTQRLNSCSGDLVSYWYEKEMAPMFTTSATSSNN